MTLGEKITQLRTARQMSQGDLAERLEVSRQSVSKWETGSSIPDLDKLLRLSELFDVTLDDLVRDGEQPSTATPPQAETVSPLPEKFPARKIVGYILLGVGLLSAVLGLAVSLLLVGLGVYLVWCGLICLLVKKHAGLVIGWCTFLPWTYVLPLFTSARMAMVFHPAMYREGLRVQLVVAFGFWVILFLLVGLTVRNTRLRRHPLLFCGWVILSQCVGFIPIVFQPAGKALPAYRTVGWGTLALAAALVFWTGRCLYLHIRQSKNAP